MKLVINIPDYIKEQADDGKGEEFGIPLWLVYEIANGTPLPKEHGRLIDADALKMDTRVCGDRYLSKTSLFVANKIIEQADTIIEAERSEKE